MNLDLRIALLRKFGTQICAARQLGFKESRLSRIIRGHDIPSAKERQALSRVLGNSTVRRLLGRGRIPGKDK